MYLFYVTVFFRFFSILVSFIGVKEGQSVLCRLGV